MLNLLAQFALPIPMAPPPIYRPNQRGRQPAYDPTDDYFRKAPQELRTQPNYNQPGKTELHGATSRENCNKMEQTFKKQGRNVRLVRVQPTTNPGAILQYICVFEGGDAQTGYFDEKRY